MKRIYVKEATKINHDGDKGGFKIMLDNLTDLIERWAIDKNLHEATPEKQMLKLMEEVGELAQGLAKNNQEQVIDSIGDVYVVLTILSMQMRMDIGDCIEQAYEEIADRKGKMVNGVFVKEEDLQ
ncbi:MazG-like family protein [Oceanobacillus sp. M60]